MRCLVCGEERAEAPACACVRCGTVHHRECWEYIGCCATYACGSRTAEALEPGAEMVELAMPPEAFADRAGPHTRSVFTGSQRIRVDLVTPLEEWSFTLFLASLCLLLGSFLSGPVLALPFFLGLHILSTPARYTSRPGEPGGFQRDPALLRDHLVCIPLWLLLFGAARAGSWPQVVISFLAAAGTLLGGVLWRKLDVSFFLDREHEEIRLEHLLGSWSGRTRSLPFGSVEAVVCWPILERRNGTEAVFSYTTYLLLEEGDPVPVSNRLLDIEEAHSVLHLLAGVLDVPPIPARPHCLWRVQETSSECEYLPYHVEYDTPPDPDRLPPRTLPARPLRLPEFQVLLSEEDKEQLVLDHQDRVGG